MSKPLTPKEAEYLRKKKVLLTDKQKEVLFGNVNQLITNYFDGYVSLIPIDTFTNLFSVIQNTNSLEDNIQFILDEYTNWFIKIIPEQNSIRFSIHNY